MVNIHFAGQTEVCPVQFGEALLFGVREKGSGHWERRWNGLYKSAGEFFRAVPAEEADIFHYAYDYFPPAPAAVEAARQAKQRGLRCVFLSHGDDPAPLQIPEGGMLFRQSIVSDRRLADEYAVPAFAEDCLAAQQGKVVIRRKGPTPSVGFCGYVGNPLMRTIYRVAGRQRKAEGLTLRATALRHLRRSRRVHCVFLPQQQFSGGAQGVFGSDVTKADTLFNRFIDNVLNTDYTLCVRGAGNFSYRFYETLSAGRIPLFINTRCVLPFEDRIDWRRHCVWVEEADLGRVGEVLADFHASLSDAEFVELQHANRRLWEQWLTPLGFYRKLFEGLFPGR